jgi:hypothetical protein
MDCTKLSRQNKSTNQEHTREARRGYPINSNRLTHTSFTAEATNAQACVWGNNVESVNARPYMCERSHGPLTAKLRSLIAPCDAVIHLAGFYYGAEPSQRPSGEPRRSYTQIEYDRQSSAYRPCPSGAFRWDRPHPLRTVSRRWGRPELMWACRIKP